MVLIIGGCVASDTSPRAIQKRAELQQTQLQHYSNNNQQIYNNIATSQSHNNTTTKAEQSQLNDATDTGIQLTSPPFARKQQRSFNSFSPHYNNAPHSNNIFALPDIYVYEICVKPQVYLFVVLCVWLIGPKAIVPALASFFYYRWYLNKRRMQQQTLETKTHFKPNFYSSFKPTTQQRPNQRGLNYYHYQPQRQQQTNTNIHSLADLQNDN